jgi:hypothetical protein
VSTTTPEPERPPERLRGFYTVSEVARLTELEARQIRNWVKGYTYTRRGAKKTVKPLFKSQARYESETNTLLLSFPDLIEVMFVKAFLDKRVSVPTIRRVAAVARELLRTQYPFSVRSFATDGRTVFARIHEQECEHADRLPDEQLLDLKTMQQAFPSVMEPVLETIDYDDHGIASRWWPLGKDRPVVLDPARSFGAAITSRSCVPARVLYNAHLGGNSARSIAHWYEIQEEEVDAAILFGQRYLGRAA